MSYNVGFGSDPALTGWSAGKTVVFVERRLDDSEQPAFELIESTVIDGDHNTTVLWVRVMEVLAQLGWRAQGEWERAWFGWVADGSRVA